MEKITCTVEGIIYRNEENGYTVAACDHGNVVVTIVGELPSISEGERLELHGTWQKHASYGSQFKVSKCKNLPPDSKAGLIRYMASGAIHGVGPVTAAAIVDALGIDALDKITENPSVLGEIPGIGYKRAETIAKSFEAQRNVQEIMVLLQSLKIGLKLSSKILKKYNEATMHRMKNDPYQLVEDIDGIGFASADKIARQLGVSKFAPTRIKAGIIHILQQAASGEGHTCYPESRLRIDAAKLLDSSDEELEKGLKELYVARKLVCRVIKDENYAYLAAFHYAEMEVAKRLKNLTRLDRKSVV